MRQPGGALPEDLFTPRAHELLLVLAPPLGPAAAGAPNEATWASRARVAPEGALGQRPASWPRDEGPLPMSNPTTPVPYNKGFPDAPPPFGTVRAPRPQLLRGPVNCPRPCVLWRRLLRR